MSILYIWCYRLLIIAAIRAGYIIHPYVLRYSTRYAKYTNTSEDVGHRFGHQSGLDESSERISTTCLHGIAFRVYLMMPKYVETMSIYKNIQNITFAPKHIFGFQKRSACGKPETP